MNKDGSSFIGENILDKVYHAIFSRSVILINLKNDQDSKILILNGVPINELLEAYGPIVMNTIQ